MELGGFGVDRERSAPSGRSHWTRSRGCSSRSRSRATTARWISMPPRNVVPKPRQRPHPPLWVACSRRETILTAAQRGLGALSFAFVEPEDAKEWVDSYYETDRVGSLRPGRLRRQPQRGGRPADDVPPRRGDRDRTRHRRRPLLRLLARLLLRHSASTARATRTSGGSSSNARRGRLRARDRHARRRAARGAVAAARPGKPARGDRHAGSDRGPDRSATRRPASTR